MCLLKLLGNLHTQVEFNNIGCIQILMWLISILIIHRYRASPLPSTVLRVNSIWENTEKHKSKRYDKKVKFSGFRMNKV